MAAGLRRLPWCGTEREAAVAAVAAFTGRHSRSALLRGMTPKKEGAAPAATPVACPGNAEGAARGDRAVKEASRMAASYRSKVAATVVCSKLNVLSKYMVYHLMYLLSSAKRLQSIVSIIFRLSCVCQSRPKPPRQSHDTTRRHS